MGGIYWTMEDLRKVLELAKLAEKYTARARIELLMHQLEDSEEDRIKAPDCPPTCTGDPWPWCCGGVPV